MRARNLATVFIGSLVAPSNNERDTVSCGKAKKNVEKSVPAFTPYQKPHELSRDKDRVADNSEEKKTKEMSGKAARRSNFFPLFQKAIQEEQTRTYENPPSPAGMISEAIRGGFSKIPGGISIAATVSIAGQAFLSSVGGERAAALSPTRTRENED